MEPQQPQQLLISVELAQRVLNYIASQPTTRPTGEVFQLLQEIQSLSPHSQQKTEEGEESPYAPSGIHETTDGLLIGVGENGEIMEITEAAADAVTEEVVEEAMEEVEVEVPVSEEAMPATEELLNGIAEMIAPFTEEIAALTEEVVELKAKFSKLADEPAAKPIRNSFSEIKADKDAHFAKRMEALRALRNN